MGESLFGAMDVENIPKNPFWTKAGTYDAIVKSVSKRVSRGNHKFVIQYAITEVGSEFYGNRVDEWIDFDPSLSEEDLKAMSAEERAIVRKAASRIKNRLDLFGVPEKDMNDPDLDLKSLEGIEVVINVINKGDDNEYSNINSVRLP